MADPLAALLTCFVIGVADGDTMTLRCETALGHENLKVRIAKIDAEAQSR